MYRILNVTIDGFRGDRKIELNFPDDNVTIIHGSNGTGKTTLLKILHAIFSGNGTLLESEQIKKGSIILKNRKTNIICYIEAEYSSDKNEYEWFSDIEDIEDYIESFSSLVFGVNRGITVNNALGRVSPLDVSKMLRLFKIEFVNNSENKKASRNIEEMSDFLNNQIQTKYKRQRRNSNEIDFDNRHIMIDNLSMSNVENTLHDRYLLEKNYITNRVQKALFETLAQIVDNPEEDSNLFSEEEFLDKLIIYSDTLLEVLLELPNNQLSNRIRGILENFDENSYYQDFVNPFEGKYILSSLVYNMIIELEKGRGVLNSVTQLVDEFNTYLNDNKKLIIDEKGPRISTPNGFHSIDKLSSGERHLLSFLTLFIIDGSDRNVLMIDEPEISLNLKWQSKLLNLLTRCVPDAQIIVATHSPAIAEYNTNNLVEIKE
ncbi:putative ATPase [Paenibacillus sp. 4624]|uniref:AAA family ATPase n=1 Tax=Paenibacillus sp. 4624 TaxID=3156453 RepID=UPI003D19F909